jgi:hypothetical protein
MSRLPSTNFALHPLTATDPLKTTCSSQNNHDKENKQQETNTIMDAGFLEIIQPQDVGSYKNILLRFMAYKHGRPVSFTRTGWVKVKAYPRDHHFSNVELQAILPIDICNWLCLVAYNKESPTRTRTGCVKVKA